MVKMRSFVTIDHHFAKDPQLVHLVNSAHFWLHCWAFQHVSFLPWGSRKKWSCRKKTKRKIKQLEDLSVYCWTEIARLRQVFKKQFRRLGASLFNGPFQGLSIDKKTWIAKVQIFCTPVSTNVQNTAQRWPIEQTFQKTSWKNIFFKQRPWFTKAPDNQNEHLGDFWVPASRWLGPISVS